MIYKLALGTVPPSLLNPPQMEKSSHSEIGPPHAPIHGHCGFHSAAAFKVGDKLQLYTEITLNQQVNLMPPRPTPIQQPNQTPFSSAMPSPGKTGSLVSLVKAGYKLRILDFDNLLDVLKYMIIRECPEKIDNVEFRTSATSVRQPPLALSSMAPKAFIEAGKMLDRVGSTRTTKARDRPRQPWRMGTGLHPRHRLLPPL